MTDPAHASAVVRPVAPVVDLADAEWCWSRLRSTSRGVLSSSRPRRPVNLHVGCTLDDGQVLVPVAPSYEVLHLLAGFEVALSLAGLAEDGRRWLVRATGTALLFAVPAESGRLVARSRSGAGRPLRPVSRARTVSSALLVLPVDRVRGYREVPPDGRIS